MRLRRWADDSVAGDLMDSFGGASLVAALPAALLLGTSRRRRLLLLWPALSAAAMLLERCVGALGPVPEPELIVLPAYSESDRPLYYEDIREEVE
ncbi:hypothetical protein SAMN05444157_0424 [Frankineae bacterium MT45]|nr:hypothetical protein SAMN05444157_0424 [Frankineae bacterium MT45]